MKRRELLAACEQIIKSFDPAKTTVDAHAEEQLLNLPNASPSERLFLQQVFYGSFRYRELLRPALTRFLEASAGKGASRRDYTAYLVLSYLAIFRLGEIGGSRFGALVTCGAIAASSAHALLAFLFDESELSGELRESWIKVLDPAFVDTEIIAKMRKCRAETIEALLAQLHATAFGSGTSGASSASPDATADTGVTKKKITVPVAPNITQPKPRRAAEPIAIPQSVKAAPVPSNLNAVPLLELEKQKRERRERIQRETATKYADAAKDQFKLESGARSNLEQVRREVEAARAKELQFDFKAKPAPALNTSPSAGETIKLNAAAILREDALLKKKKEKEAQVLRAYEAELRDPMEFYRWQAQAQAQDERENRELIEKRRLEMAQAQHDAIEAAARAKLENRELALQMKSEAHERLAEKEKQDAELLDAQRENASEMKQIRDAAPREAEDRVKEENKRQREELLVFMAAERERRAAQDAVEQAQREDLIRQIRALERVHREHVAVFDPASTMQLGLLEEMSLSELRERLDVRKAEQLAWEASRREDINADKTEKREMLEDKARGLAKARQTAASVSAVQRERRKAAERAKLEEMEAKRREGNLKLAEKLQQQRAAREAQTAALKAEAEEIAKKRMFLGAAKNLLEESHFDQLEQGAEREMRNRQTTMQASTTTNERVRRQEQDQRTMNSRVDRAKKAKENAQRDSEVEMARRDGVNKARDEDELLRSMVRHEKRRYLHAQEVLKNRNVYATAQSTQLTIKARESIAAKTGKLVTRPMSGSGALTSIRSRNQLEEQVQMLPNL